MDGSKSPSLPIIERLTLLYGAERAAEVYQALNTRIGAQTEQAYPPLDVSEKDAVVIAYGDHLHRADEASLRTLYRTLQATIGNAVTGVHLLPFFPYSSDDGFSVIDYRAVDPALGTWDDVAGFKPMYKLMFDAVINHISQHSAWFQAYLRGEPPYDAYFIAVDPALDLSMVTRPRALPLLHPYQTADGIKHVWTTFSDDQIDLNYANPVVLIEIIDILLDYVRRGADLIRLDAIAFLWKEINTTCMHLPQTHAAIQIMRAVLDAVAPHVILITETNVPHIENISYFGDGVSEAQMVYQFALPPLVLHTFRTGDARKLSAWAATIERPSERTTFFNFLASHDGIGVRPIIGILDQDEIDALVNMVLGHGGLVSYRNNPDGSKSPYELNITYFDAVTDPAITAADQSTAIERFRCAHAILLALIGVPGIYLHSLYGSRNWRGGVAGTGETTDNRAINREKLDADQLLSELRQPGIRAEVFAKITQLLTARMSSSAFHPLGKQRILDYGDQLFAVERTSPDGRERALALHNVSGYNAPLTLPRGNWNEILNCNCPVSADQYSYLAPYEVLWLIER